MLKRWFKVVAIVVLILLPIGIWWSGMEVLEPLQRTMSDYPSEITIPTGPIGGQHEKITESLGREIGNNKTLNVKLAKKPVTKGSLQNLRALQNGEIDFGLYQAGTANSVFKSLDTDRDSKLTFAEFHSPDFKENTRVLFSRLDENGNDVVSLDEFKGTSSISFVANLYPEVAHFVVRLGSGIEGPDDLRGRSIALGERKSGDYAMSRILLEYFGLDKDRDIHAEYLTYDEIEDRFLNEELAEDEKLDAAFITVGIQAEVFRKLSADGECKLLPIPFADALAKQNVLISKYEIPAGLYRIEDGAVPAGNIQTVAVTAQLLTRADMNADVVQAVTEIVLDKHFASQNNLRELLEGGRAFSRARPEFPTHEGAQNIYQPEFDIHLIETGEAAYSLTVSTLIAFLFGVRWFNQQRAKKKGHKLDVYIKKLLDIEKRQISLDADSRANDLANLQKLLDEVTFLRQEALRVFSVYELNEDRGADCFITMCHALSNKINAKLSRQRLDQRFAELSQAITNQNQRQAEDNAESNSDTSK